MELVIDGRTMAVSTPSGVPVMDISLVLGDTMPVRIRVDHALTDCTPALAVKQSIGSADLIMTVTDWTREDDWQTASWVINTVPLQAALGNADSVALVAEVVLVAPDGAQHTSRPIRMTVRRDILPAEFAPPAEVLADWSRLVAAALSSQLPDALQEAGVNITPVTGSSTLSTGEAETPTVMACYALTWGDELLAGHLTDSCRLRRVSMTYYTDTGLMDAHWLRVWRLEGGKYVVIGVATAVALPINNQPIAWDFAPGVPLQRGDKIMLEICAGPDADHLTTRGLGVHAVITPVKDGRGMASSVHYPPEITMATMAPMMTVTVDYDEGVSVGGVELATATQVQVLGSDVRTASANSQAAAQSAATARDQAQAAVAGLSVTMGTVTTGVPGSQASAAMTPGSTPGSWRMDMTIPRGDAGVVDTSQAYTWTQPQTYAAAINANGGINAVSTLAAGVSKTGINAGSSAVMSVLGNVYHLDHLNGALTILDGSNIKMERALEGWCGLSWAGTLTAHKCALVKSAVTNTNYGGAVSPAGIGNYALVMSLLSGVNLAATQTKFGWTGYSGTVTATRVEDIPGPLFYVDAGSRKVVARSGDGQVVTELSWAALSLDWVSRFDLIAVPASSGTCSIYLARHAGVSSGHGNHYNFNRRYLTPQTYYIGEVPVGLTGNDCHYAIVDTCSEQMAMFRVSVIQGVNPAEYLNVETIS